MPKVKFLKVITMGSSEMPIGTIDEVDEQSAAALVREGAAELVEVEAIDDDQDPDKQADQDDAKVEGETAAEADETKAQVILDEAAAEPTAEDLTMIRKAFDAQYKRDEIYEAAKAVGVEISYDAKKGEIIEAVIAAGHADTLLK